MSARIVVGVWWLLALTYPVWTVLGIVGWLDEPRIGIDARPNSDGQMVITEVHPGKAAWDFGVRPGDVLLEIDGSTIDEQRWRQKGDAGSDFRILSFADGSPTVKSLRRDPQFSRPIVFSFVTLSLVFAVSSFFIFSRSNRSGEILALSLFLLTSATAFAVAPATDRLHWWAMILEAFAVDWSPALFFVFTSMFFLGLKNTNSAFRALPWVMVTSALALDILYLLSVTALPDIYDGIRQLAFAFLGVGFLGGVTFLIAAYFSSNSAIAREQIRIMVFGLALAVVPFALLSMAPMAVGLSWIVRPEVAVLAFAFLPLSFGYAIMRHHVMGIRRLVHRGAAYALISLVVFVIYSAVIATLHAAGGSDVSGNLAVQIILLVILFAAVPFVSGTKRLAFAAVDRLLYHEYVNHTDLVRRVSIDAAHSQHMDEVAQRVLGTIKDELQLSFAAFVGVSEGKPTVKASAGDIPGNLGEAACLLNGDNQKSLIDDHSSESSVPSLRNLAKNSNEQTLVVNLKRPPHREWVLYLGPKVTEEPFQREDLELAESVASHIATIVEKLELLEELRTKAAELRELNSRLVRAQETERGRIASHLHDEPLQQITNLIWRYSGSSLPPEVLKELQSIAEDLRNFTTRLHPALLEDLGLVRALEWLGTEASAASGLKVVFAPVTVKRDERLESETELALYRIAQEALTNCRRHARASSVWLSLARDDSQVTLVIEDDGVGFPPQRGFEPGTRLGLIGMRERAEQLGGHLNIAPRSPSGTKVVASLPINGQSNFKEVEAHEVNLDDQSVDR